MLGQFNGDPRTAEAWRLELQAVTHAGQPGTQAGTYAGQPHGDTCGTLGLPTLAGHAGTYAGQVGTYTGQAYSGHTGAHAGLAQAAGHNVCGNPSSVSVARDGSTLPPGLVLYFKSYFPRGCPIP